MVYSYAEQHVHVQLSLQYSRGASSLSPPSLPLTHPPSQYIGICDMTLDAQDMRLESLLYVLVRVDETQPAKIYKLARITHKQYKRGKQWNLYRYMCTPSVGFVFDSKNNVYHQ